MSNRETIDSLLRAVANNPKDQAPKYALADAYESDGYPTLATIWRWLADTGRHPYPPDGGNQWYSDKWLWWREEEDQPQSPNRLPIKLLDQMESSYASSLEEVVAKIAPAWKKVTAGGWFRKPWVPDHRPIGYYSPAEYRLNRATRGVR